VSFRLVVAEILAAQFVQRRHECMLPHDPCAIFRDHAIVRTFTSDERIAAFARPSDINAIWRRALADLSGIENLDHLLSLW
jgi:hypothetical protein